MRMINLVFKKFTCCLKFRQLMVAFFVLLACSLNAQENDSNVISYKDQSYKTNESGTPYFTVSSTPIRTPASTGYRENMMEDVPAPAVTGINRIFVQDENGILNSMKDSNTKWRTTEQNAENWNLESTGLYETPSDEEKGLYYKKSFLKYLEKRFLGEIRRQGKTVFTATKATKKDQPKETDKETKKENIKKEESKNADESTALMSDEARKNMNKVRKILDPTASKQIAKNTQLKVRVRPLQGRVFFVLQNPYADTELRLSAKKEVVVNMNRNFDSIGLGTSVNYEATQKVWAAQVNKTITNTISANFSSSQKTSQMAFSGGAIKVVQLVYNLPF